jgi:hypothetical protein
MEDVYTNAQDGHWLKKVTLLVEVKFVRPFPTMVITASVEYISASVNRFNRSSAASSSSLVAFGSGKFVALWDSQVSFPLVHAVI